MTQLTAFLAVVEGGSVTAAADALMVTQPSVSSAIASLGRELGCELFERSGRGVRLTEAGTAFAPYATDVVGLLESGRHAVHEASELTASRLQIIAVTTAAESFVPPLMRAFSDRHPRIELTLDVGNRERVLDRIRSRRVDVAILGKPPADDRLFAEPLFENEIVCIAAPDDPAVGRVAVPASSLGDRAWLLREPGSGTRALNEQFLADRGMAPRLLTLASNGAIKQAARAGLGVSLMSRDAVEGELTSDRLGEIRLADGPPVSRWFVLRSAVGPVRPAVGSFLEFARTAAVATADRSTTPRTGARRGSRSSSGRTRRRPPPSPSR
jgi:LysR family transcriptional regulator, low CO2-responsive transcriptional regulator